MKDKRQPMQFLIACFLSRSLPWIALAVLPLALSAPLLASEETQKRVLVFYSTRKEAPYPTLGEKIFQKTLSEGLGGRLDYYSEYLDVARFSELEYQDALRDFLRRKYQGWYFDLIIATSDRCIEFYQRYGESLLPGSPVVFIRDENESPLPNATGVSTKIDLKGTLDLALKLQPRTKRVFVISGASAFDKGFEDLARRQFQEFERRITFTYLDACPLADLHKTVANLPPDSIIYFLMLLEDGSGNRFLLTDSVDKLSAVANAPIYGWFDAAIDHGIVGGSLMSLEVVAQKTAELGLRVLRGERPENIPVAELQIHFPMFDWRQLRRWGLDEQKLPPGSIVRFRELTFWDHYKWRIVGVISFSILEALLIIWLLINRSRRREAEETKNNLAAIVESSDDAILSKTLEGTITIWNASAEKIYGYSASEMKGRHISILAPADLKGEVTEILERIKRGESIDHLETVRLTKDGRRIDVSLTISPIKDEHGIIIGASTIARDVTIRKRADQELRESEERFHTMADTAPVMVWVSGPDTLCTFFNRPWLEFTGRTMAQELGNGWAEGVHPEDFQRCLDVYHSAFRVRRNFTMEYRLRRADGQYRWVVENGAPRQLPNGSLAGYIGTCLDITDRRRDELALQMLTGRLLMLQDEERRRVAAELHDGLGQSLAIIKNRALLGLGDQTNQDQAIEQLEEISATATSAIFEVREIAHNLRPYELDRLGLVPAIESMVERVSDSTSVNLSTDLELIDGLLSLDAETSVYRIVQEGLNNVIKHSHATAARIEIKKNGKQLTISIQDNGTGMTPPAPADNGNRARGFGLAGITERVRLLGGSLAIDSRPTGGTTMTIRLELSGGTRE
jgi:PAS domain S-box-containing protein